MGVKGSCAILSATLLSLVYSLPWGAPLSLLAVTPLAWVFSQSNLKTRLLLTALTGLLFQGWLHRWAIPYSPEGWCVLTLWKTLPMLLLALSQGKSWVFASLWVGTEWLGSVGPLGHTGGSLSLAWADYPLAIQSAALAGPWLLSFTIALLGAALAYRETAGLLTGLGLVVCLALFGQYRLNLESESPQLRVAVIQSCLDRHLKFLDPVPVRPMQQLARLTERAAAEADLVVWPETAFPGVGLRWDANWSIRFGRLARRSEADLLLASLEEEEEGYLNTLHLVTTEGKFSGRYCKRRRVPFVEYLPWEGFRQYPLFSRVNRILQGEIEPPLTVRGHRLGPLICWESMRPSMARQRALEGAELLVVCTNDEWFEPSQDVARAHFRMAVFRAAENNRPLAQAANTGVSALIDNKGRVLARSVPGRRELLVATLQPQQARTPYTRWGDWFLFLPGLLLGLTVLRRGRPGGPDKG